MRRVAASVCVGSLILLQSASLAGNEPSRVRAMGNGLLAVSSASSYGLWVFDPERPGSQRRELARRGSWPTWSPDGRRIAYQVYRTLPPRDGRSIWVSDAAGGNRRKVIANGSMPDWSPSAREFAYIRDDGVYVARSDGRRQRRIIANTRNRHFQFVRWSPSGRFLALSAWEPNVGQYGTARMYVRAVAAGPLHLLVNPAPERTAFVWAPDGRRVASSTCLNEGRDGTIKIFDSDRRELERTLNTPRCPYHLAWAPDGGSIAYCRSGGIDRISLIGPPRATVVAETGRCSHGFAWQPEP